MNVIEKNLSLQPSKVHNSPLHFISKSELALTEQLIHKKNCQDEDNGEDQKREE